MLSALSSSSLSPSLRYCIVLLDIHLIFTAKYSSLDILALHSNLATRTRIALWSQLGPGCQQLHQHQPCHHDPYQQGFVTRLWLQTRCCTMLVASGQNFPQKRKIWLLHQVWRKGAQTGGGSESSFATLFFFFWLGSFQNFCPTNHLVGEFVQN